MHSVRLPLFPSKYLSSLTFRCSKIEPVNHKLPGNPDVSELVGRALPNAPDGYAPVEVNCPSPRPSVRSAAKLSSNEQDWLKLRQKTTRQAMKDWFGHVRIGDLDAVAYLDD